MYPKPIQQMISLTNGLTTINYAGGDESCKKINSAGVQMFLQLQAVECDLLFSLSLLASTS